MTLERSNLDDQFQEKKVDLIKREDVAVASDQRLVSLGEYGAQSFTSLHADLHQDINRGFALALMGHFLEGTAPSRLWYIHRNERVTNEHLLF